jgi:alginate O-acetyltransferase complex protein AlgI
LVNAVFGHSGQLTCLEAWAGVLAYAFQLYFDFSGYSDMAIGISLFFNIRLPDNFHAPYRAVDIVDFWRRWHMTLSRFLRDYLYIPLGGNRHGSFRRFLNLFLTMLLGGIWHGAGWNFLVWGAYHGLLLIGCHCWQSLRRPLPEWSARALTFGAVLFGWVLFRSSSLSQAGEVLSAMVNLSSFRIHALASGLQREHLVGLAALFCFVNAAPTAREWINSRPLTARHAIVLAIFFCLSLILIRNVELHFAKSEFIYFQF